MPSTLYIYDDSTAEDEVVGVIDLRTYFDLLDGEF